MLLIRVLTLRHFLWFLSGETVFFLVLSVKWTRKAFNREKMKATRYITWQFVK